MEKVPSVQRRGAMVQRACSAWHALSESILIYLNTGIPTTFIQMTTTVALPRGEIELKKIHIELAVQQQHFGGAAQAGCRGREPDHASDHAARAPGRAVTPLDPLLELCGLRPLRKILRTHGT